MNRELKFNLDFQAILSILMIISIILTAAFSYARLEAKSNDIAKNTEKIADVGSSINAININLAKIEQKLDSTCDDVKEIKLDTAYLRKQIGD